MLCPEVGSRLIVKLWNLFYYTNLKAGYSTFSSRPLCGARCDIPKAVTITLTPLPLSELDRFGLSSSGRWRQQGAEIKATSIHRFAISDLQHLIIRLSSSRHTVIRLQRAALPAELQGPTLLQSQTPQRWVRNPSRAWQPDPHTDCPGNTAATPGTPHCPASAGLHWQRFHACPGNLGKVSSAGVFSACPTSTELQLILRLYSILLPTGHLTSKPFGQDPLRWLVRPAHCAP